MSIVYSAHIDFAPFCKCLVWRAALFSAPFVRLLSVVMIAMYDLAQIRFSQNTSDDGKSDDDDDEKKMKTIFEIAERDRERGRTRKKLFVFVVDLPKTHLTKWQKSKRQREIERRKKANPLNGKI